MDSVNSTTFIKRPPYMTDTQEKFLYTKELLTGRIFLGCYHERRLVPLLNEYRDVVVISSEETDLHRDLDKLRQKWLGVREIKWVGITGPDAVDLPKAYCFWVKLTNLAFGEHWFQIKHVKLVDEEIILQLKHIRSQGPLASVTPKRISKHTSISKNEVAEVSTSSELFGKIDWRNVVTSFQVTLRNGITYTQPHLTLKNFLLMFKLTFTLFFVLVVGLLSMIGSLGEFLLKLIREITLLVNAFTPITVQIIDLLSKTIGGFFILLYGMFTRNNVSVHRQEKPDSYSVQYLEMTTGERNRKPPAVGWRERNENLRKEFLDYSVKRY